MQKPLDTVTASEIAEWAYCPEAWRLAELGLSSSNQPARDAGTTHHAHKAIAERVASSSIAVGQILIVVALLALAALWAFSR